MYIFTKKFSEQKQAQDGKYGQSCMQKLYSMSVYVV